MSYFFNFAKKAYIKGERPDGCILCLIRDEDPNVEDLVVYRGTDVYAVVNLYPYNPGHIMICPNRHVEDIRDLSEAEEGEMQHVLRLVLDGLDRTHQPHAYNIGFNMGSVAGASIAHLHQHVIPRDPREIGVADLIAGKRVLVEDPRETHRRLKATLNGLSDAGR